MTRRTLVSLLLLATLLAGVLPAAAQPAERDRLAPVTPEPPPYAAFPPGILSQGDTDTVAAVVREARAFGVPLAVRVIAVPTVLAPLGVGDMPQRITQQLADEWLAGEPVESSEGADDGILLLVVIPRDDHTRTTAAFATGAHALPQNGLTRERLDSIVRDVMTPRFAANSIGFGVNEGVATLSYENLFLPSPRLELTENQETLQRVTNLLLATITALGALAAFGVVLWLRARASRRTEGEPGTLSPFAAGALARGRVDDAATTGALLHLVETGALVPRTAPLGGTALEVAEAAMPELDPFATRILALVHQQATGTPAVLAPAAMRWLPRLLDPARKELENDLARRGLINRQARVETAWALLAAGGALAAALYAIVPSIVGMARWGIFAAVAAMVIAIGVLWWATHRSWTTPLGREALAGWLAAHPEPSSSERAIFEAIVEQDQLLGWDGGATSGPVRLVRALRGLGAA